MYFCTGLRATLIYIARCDRQIRNRLSSLTRWTWNIFVPEETNTRSSGSIPRRPCSTSPVTAALCYPVTNYGEYTNHHQNSPEVSVELRDCSGRIRGHFSSRVKSHQPPIPRMTQMKKDGTVVPYYTKCFSRKCQTCASEQRSTKAYERYVWII